MGAKGLPNTLWAAGAVVLEVGNPSELLFSLLVTFATCTDLSDSGFLRSILCGPVKSVESPTDSTS